MAANDSKVNRPRSSTSRSSAVTSASSAPSVARSPIPYSPSFSANTPTAVSRGVNPSRARVADSSASSPRSWSNAGSVSRVPPWRRPPVSASSRSACSRSASERVIRPRSSETTDFSDYRAVNGIKVAHKHVSKGTGAQARSTLLEIKNVEIDPKVDPKAFEKPTP